MTAGRAPIGVSIVVPTVGRPALGVLLRALGPLPEGMELLVVDDRPDRSDPLWLPPETTARIIPGRAAGPAAARNTGWRAARHEWIAFLDDDVIPDEGWTTRLAEDLRAASAATRKVGGTRPDAGADGGSRGAGSRVGGVQGRLWVPLPSGRRPTDWERVTAGLAEGEWITADMAYRRTALMRVGGFDERLPRAFREDAELAHRVRRAGWELRLGTRSTAHPVRPEQRWISLRTQRGNADDALLRHLYGPRWRTELGIPPGRRHRHAAITACLATTIACTAAAVATARASSRAAAGSEAGSAGRSTAWSAGRSTAWSAARFTAGPAVRFTVRAISQPTARIAAGESGRFRNSSRAWSVAAFVAVAGWAAGTAEFAARRIAPGPRDRREVTTMLLTSAAIPPVAIAHWLRGWFRWRGAEPMRDMPTSPARGTAAPAPADRTDRETAPAFATAGEGRDEMSRRPRTGFDGRAESGRGERAGVDGWDEGSPGDGGPGTAHAEGIGGAGAGVRR